MIRLGRYALAELSLRRLWSALKVRVAEAPNSVAWSLLAEANLNRAGLRQFAGLHAGRRGFIVANGPSLKHTNLGRLSGELTFGLNRIYLLFDEISFRPTYYLAMNELIIEQFTDDIRRLNMPKFINWNRRAYFSRGDSGVFYLKSKMSVNDSFQGDVTRPIVVGGTVTFVALQLAYYMGFQEVILVGLDHRYAEKGTPSQTEVRPDAEDRSHFHPAYFPKGVRWQLPDLLRSEIDFALARRAFERAGRRVLDATIGGACPVFERVDYDTLFI